MSCTTCSCCGWAFAGAWAGAVCAEAANGSNARRRRAGCGVPARGDRDGDFNFMGRGG